MHLTLKYFFRKLKDNKNSDYTIDDIRRNKFKNIKNQIKIIKGDLNNIDNQIQSYYNNLKEAFKNEIKNELSNFKK